MPQKADQVKFKMSVILERHTAIPTTSALSQVAGYPQLESDMIAQLTLLNHFFHRSIYTSGSSSLYCPKVG
jgi:hypothetical protein